MHFMRSKGSELKKFKRKRRVTTKSGRVETNSNCHGLGQHTTHRAALRNSSLASMKGTRQRPITAPHNSAKRVATRPRSTFRQISAMV
mmetsp:Transcript_23589/g.52457  ORF Transcript_23589/g.52457 Transcript_23589/m.52457 type:complete len:88 (-) Transcript_23589:728-991(-)